MRLSAVSLAGGFLVALSTFQAEFDFGVPQFRFVLQPMLIMLAAGVGLVAVRLWAGRGTALGAVAFFLALRGRAGAGRRPGARRDHAAPAAVRGGGAGGRGRGAAAVRRATPARIRALLRRRHRHARARLRVGRGRTSGCRSHGPPSCCPRPRCSVSPRRSSAGVLGAWIGSHLAVTPRPRSPRLRGGAVVAAAALAAMLGVGALQAGRRGRPRGRGAHGRQRGPSAGSAADVTAGPAGRRGRRGVARS